MSFKSIAPLREFVIALSELVDGGADEARIVSEGSAQLQRLVARDDWLPDAFAAPHPQFYQQYLLYADPRDRFSVVSFVWGPGQKTPVHDHLVWGLVGGLRGREKAVNFGKLGEGKGGDAPTSVYTILGEAYLNPGEVTAVSPTLGDVHAVSNALDDQVSISIHVYGGNIGRIHRHVFDPVSGAEKAFISGYASPVVPNLWD